MGVSDTGWRRTRAGVYSRTSGSIDAIVRQDGELWRGHVYVGGIEVDRGEWDGRGIALRNTKGAMVRARALRVLDEITRDDDGDDSHVIG